MPHRTIVLDCSMLMSLRPPLSPPVVVVAAVVVAADDDAADAPDGSIGGGSSNGGVVYGGGSAAVGCARSSALCSSIRRVVHADSAATDLPHTTSRSFVRSFVHDRDRSMIEFSLMRNQIDGWMDGWMDGLIERINE